MSTWLDLVVSPSGISAATALPLNEQSELLRSFAEHASSAPPPRRLLLANLSLTILYRARVPLYELPDFALINRMLAQVVEVGWATLDSLSGPPELFSSLPLPVRQLGLARWTVQLLPRLAPPDVDLAARSAAAEATLGEALASGDEEGHISAELAEWLLAAGRGGEASSFLIAAISRSPSARLQALLVACESSAGKVVAYHTFTARASVALTANDSSALRSLLQAEALAPAAGKYRAWREAMAASNASEAGAVLRAYNAITFGPSAGVLASAPPLELIAAAEWVMSSAPALTPRAVRLLLSIPRSHLPPQEQLPPAVAIVVAPRLPARSLVPLASVAPLPAPPPPPAVSPLLAPLLEAGYVPYDVAPESVAQACVSPPSCEGLRASEAATLIAVLAGVIGALGLGPSVAPLPLAPYGNAAAAIAASFTPVKDSMHAHAPALLGMWRAAAAQLHRTDASNPLPYLVEADALIESNRLGPALAPLLRYWAAHSSSFARALPAAVLTDVSWRRAALCANAYGLPIAAAAMCLFSPVPEPALAARYVTDALATAGGAQGSGAVFAEYITEPSLLELLYSAPGKPRQQLLALLARPEASQHNSPAARATYLSQKRATFLKQLLRACG